MIETDPALLATLEPADAATIVVLDHAGHNAHLDQPFLAGVLVSDWLTRLEAWRKS